MARYKLLLEWDGRPFAGWQRQDGVPSIQQSLEEAVERYCGERVTVFGAGRTDAGVHAMGMAASFELAAEKDPREVMKALNAHLRPAPISVLSAQRAAADFHARFSCTGRRYMYRYVNRRAPLALDAGRAWLWGRPMDEKAMAAAGKVLEGRHDFSAFRSAECQADSPVKTMGRVDVERLGEEIRLHVAARSFLHNQVRIIAGTLRDVGIGKLTADDVRAALETGDRRKAGETAPPDGLYFMEATYE